MEEGKEELKSLLMRVKEESKKLAWNSTFKKLTSWHLVPSLHGNLIFLGSKITANSDCSHEIKRCFLLGRKAMKNLDSILESRGIILLTKVHASPSYGFFLVAMYGCESWTIKKTENQRTDAFELWCWRRLLKIPWTARRSNQSILKEINLNIHWKDYAEAPILWPPDAKSWLNRKDPDAGKDLRKKEKRVGEDKMVRQHHWLDGHEFVQTLRDSGGQRSLMCYRPRGCKELDMTQVTK